MNKKKFFIIAFIISVLVNIITVGIIGFAWYKNRVNRDIFRLNAYAYANSQLNDTIESEKRVVFIGNSIVENWAHLRFSFFSQNGYINRGVGGQTSSLLLLRFYHDVVDLHPKAVVINAGINDIAENTGVYDIDFTMNNIKAMCQLADINGIKVIMSSVLPSSGFGFKGHIQNVPGLIDELNKRIKEFTQTSGYYYLDYHTMMKNEEGGMKKEYTFDELHPNEKGYEIMEPLVQKAINEVLTEE
ncbi:GDSL-type esterase/lipase family protein [Dysgonomonas sp. 511]|uniref:GDSL-type esterase/lipase family protein n=1 Tax=Dysgonomonas sp. 511 TaxID=2302930 RepID=UPI0013D2A70B|nr:GDSL-type esterase/lipase family protein [Dysgonomonas sp. 511]NDV78455.1 capsular biosynthesis protein [Dysgonomonas sp. 511]